MANAVFVNKPDSPYDDSPSHYQFPKNYLTRVEQTVGDLIIYYGTEVGQKGRFYKSVARVTCIRPDETKIGMYYADLVEHLDFDAPVDYLANGGFEQKLITVDGKVNGGTAQSAVRIITPVEFSKIIEAGFEDHTVWPDRTTSQFDIENDHLQFPGMAEDAPLFINRPIVSVLTDRKFRDRKFRKHVLDAYDRTCAFTGLRLINGGGRPEAEAAHIIPVEENGSDDIRNGLALSGTAHWMFDRGLLSIDDDFTILKSRHLNYDVDHLINKSGSAILPKNTAHWPQRSNLKWHRENRFKI
jgi:putative restriction endonuclease